MFMGEYNHIIDTKGRLIIPSKFREILGDEFVVTKGFDGCLLIYDDEGWRVLEESLKALPSNKREARELTRHFLAGAAEVEVDKQGRILLPAVLRDYAKITKDIILVGVGNKIEIWDKEQYDQITSNVNIEEIAEKISEWNIVL